MTRILQVVGALCGSAFISLSALQVATSSTGLPGSLYPAGAHISLRPSLSNGQMDCSWGFDCENDYPLFHFSHQDALHRLAGWAQYASWRSHGKSMTFNLFASRYAPGSDPMLALPWSRRAYTDLEDAARLHGFSALPDAPPIVSAGATGGSVELFMPGDTVTVVVMAGWRGQAEVEAAVVFSRHPRRIEQFAVQDLARQVRAAVSQEARSL